MRLLNAHAKNFQSYKEIDFDFSNLGLTLLSGQTKAGKSTIMDVPAWILYGTTSKDSAADDVKSWFAEEPTQGHLAVEVPSGVISVTRIRGKANQNDLYYILSANPTVKVRGKDMADTQKLLEKELGISCELFLLACYMHQFSKADSFFVAKAKDRREVLEKIADLSLPIQLADKTSEARKLAKKDLESKQNALSRAEGRQDQIRAVINRTADSFERWESERVTKAADLKTKSASFEKDKETRMSTLVEQLDALDKMIVEPTVFDERHKQLRAQLVALEQVRKDHKVAQAKLADLKAEAKSVQKERDQMSKLTGECPTCYGKIDAGHKEAFLEGMDDNLEALGAQLIPLTNQVTKLEEALGAQDKLSKAYDKINKEAQENQRLIDRFEQTRQQTLLLRAEVNRFDERIAELSKEANPFEKQLEEQRKSLKDADEATAASEAGIADTERRVTSLTWLYDKSFELRGAMLEQAVRQINKQTNDYLERYFDADLRVKMSLPDSDKVEVEINNEGYPCPYKQLSGGERCMLKLAFSISLMRAAENTAGVKLSMVMLDEALNGLDAALKIKAFNLLQTLANDYETVLLIDHHEEFKQLFANQFQVVKSGNYSEVRNVRDET